MVYDKIDKVGTYAGLSPDIRIGLEWLRNVRADIAAGVYELSPKVKAIVSEYVTKEKNVSGYEAHRDYIDIQYLVKGVEKICYIPLENLKEKIVYNKDADIAFYEALDRKPLDLELGNRFFAIFFPQDGHMPQLCVKQLESVKKIVVKVKV